MNHEQPLENLWIVLLAAPRERLVHSRRLQTRRFVPI